MPSALAVYRTERELSAAMPGADRSAVAAELVHEASTHQLEPFTSSRVEAILFIGGTASDRNRAARDRILTFWKHHPGCPVLHDRDPGAWPFLRPASPDEDWSDGDRVVVFVQDVDRAFPNFQTNATRLILTQSTYLMQKRLDRLATKTGALLIATADERALAGCSPEALSRRGPWSRTTVVRVRGREAIDPAETVPWQTPPAPSADADPIAWLRFGYNAPSPLARLDACRRAAERDGQSAVAELALASVCMEHEDFERARGALDRAAGLAPGWEAVHYERGKFWLRYDDLEQAAANFARACELMPSFAASYSNLGATLGELDRPEEALAAFRQALAFDPYGFQVLSNLGVVSREMGRLEESAATFRRVIELAPEFVFGHYNLGHTLFLQGRFAEAVAAYTEGQRRDPQRNPRQASRLALARLAAGDPEGALRDLEACLTNAPPAGREDVLQEAREVLEALRGRDADLAGGREFAARIAHELERNP